MTSYASFASRLSYQGRLTDTSGNAVANGTYSVRFAIYTDAQTTDAAWIETQNVTVQNGVFSAILGSINPINIDFNANEYYLGIKVGTDSEMSPRRQIGASAMALNSKRLDGKEVGTNANNILALNSAGGIDISGQIKTSGGIDVSSGVLNAMGGFQLNSVAVNASANELNYLTGSTSNIQGQLNNLSSSVSTTQSQLDGKLNLTGGTTTGNFSQNVSGDYTLQIGGEGDIFVGDAGFYFIDKNNNDLVNVSRDGNLNIEKGDLNVAYAIESGADITSGGNIYLPTNAFIGTGSSDSRIEFETSDAAVVHGQLGVNVLPNETSAMALSVAASLGYAKGIDINMHTNTGDVYAINANATGTATTNYGIAAHAEGATNNYAAYLAGRVKGDSTWTGQYTGSWSNADPSVTDQISVTGLTSNDVVFLFPTTERLGRGNFWVNVSNGYFTVSSRDVNNGSPVAFTETMDFNWIVISR